MTDDSKGFLKNCFLKPKCYDDVMFRVRENGTIIATLDGYAIIPREDYERLTGQVLDRAVSAHINAMFVGQRRGDDDQQ